MKDAIGDRMKEFYESRTKMFLPRRTYTIIRIDGKSFHTYTKGLSRPFDAGLIEDMDETAKYLCENIQGAKLAYIQSDEISILLTDFDDIATDAWFNGNVQKITSVAASLATAKFNQLRMIRIADNDDGYIDGYALANNKLATFDARVFTIPQEIEVTNYFIWRQKDATRNSISSVAQSLYSHKELHGENTDEMQEMIFQKGINWNNYTSREKRGGLIIRQETTWCRPKCRTNSPLIQYNPTSLPAYDYELFTRKSWEIIECPIFTQDRKIITNQIL